MNTNSNVYTVVYTTVIVVIVAAVLAFVASNLGPAQDANAKAETLRQMMSAARIRPTEELYKAKNADIIRIYSENIEDAITIGLDGRQNGTLSVSEGNIELVDRLKPQNKGIKDGGDVTLPVYRFKGGISVIPVYGAGLWGPIWGYIAFGPDCKTIEGAYFDHESETPGLGAKIKDEPWFREKFSGKQVDFTSAPYFNLSKNAEAGGGADAVDAITGATMTSKGLDDALNVWLGAYANYMNSAAAAAAEEETTNNAEEE